MPPCFTLTNVVHVFKVRSGPGAVMDVHAMLGAACNYNYFDNSLKYDFKGYWLEHMLCDLMKVCVSLAFLGILKSSFVFLNAN